MRIKKRNVDSKSQDIYEDAYPHSQLPEWTWPLYIEEGIIIIARGISRVLPASTDAAQPRSQLRPQEP